jgi:Rieske Fe-S protein
MSVADLRLSRQTALIGAGVGLVATVLAACTTNGKKPEASGDTPAAATPPPTTGGADLADVVAKTADVAVGSGVIVGEFVVTQPSPGEFLGFSSTCTHAGCALNEVVDGTINCPCHGSKFNLDGSVANGPATTPLVPAAVTVQGESIVVA